jgi:hypothetical protein
MARLAPLDGKLVTIVGCPIPAEPARDPEEGFMLWPCYSMLGPRSERLQRDPPLLARDVRPAFGHLIAVLMTRTAEVLRPKWERPTRVIGRLRLGDVRDRRLLWAWGDIVDAQWELLDSPEGTE